MAIDFANLRPLDARWIVVAEDDKVEVLAKVGRIKIDGKWIFPRSTAEINKYDAQDALSNLVIRYKD